MYVQELLIVISSIRLNQQIMAYDGIQLIKEVGNSLCPYTNYCHTNASRHLNVTDEYIPSCLPCSCDNDCWEFQNCCPDKEETISQPTILPCKLSKVKGLTGIYDPPSIGDILNQRAGANFRVVYSCPASENNITLKQKCAGNNRDRLRDYVWVSDSTNGMPYRNIHCAKCHGVEQFWFWSIQTSCQGILDAAVNIEETILSMDCDITNVVQEEKASLVAKYQCYDYDIREGDFSTCNVSAELSNDFIIACIRSTWLYIVEPIFGNIGLYYQNVFCYACLFGIDGVEIRISAALSGRGEWKSFSAVLNYLEKPEEKKIDEQHSCYSSQIFNPYMNMCRELHCPFGKYPWYGHCEQRFVGLRNTCLWAMYYVEVILDHNMQQMSYSTLKDYLDSAEEQVLNHTSTMAKWGKTECYVRSKIVRIQHEDEETNPAYGVSFSILLGPSCDLYNATENALNLIGETTVERTNENRLDLRLRLNFESKEINEEFYNPVFHEECKGRIRLDNDIVCPQIELVFSDAERFSREKKKERFVFLSFFDNIMTLNETTVVRVCVDEYLKAMSTANGGCSFTDAWTVILSLCFLVYSSYCL